MKLVKYYHSPIEEFDRIFRNFDVDRNFFVLPVDVEETDDSYVVTAEIPGFTSDEIEIEVLADQLTIKAEHKSEVKDENIEDENVEEQSGPRYIFRERRTRNFMRKLRFRKPIKAGEATSTINNGVLAITLPKTAEAKPVKLIPQAN